MKKFVYNLVALSLLVLLITLPAEGKNDWVLYDNFDSGIIDPELWDIDNSSAIITIENGKARFEHQSGYPGDFAKLIFKQCPDKILGIRATITVESCEEGEGDVSTRNFSWIGEDEDGNWIAYAIKLNPYYNNIFSFVHAWDPINNKDAYQLFDGYFKKPVTIIGTDFTVEASIDSNYDFFEFKVNDIGTITCISEQIILNSLQNEKFIGTKSNSGNGSCVIYFDNVYILRSDKCKIK